MSNKDLNIKSSTIEKGLELAQNFLGKLISPTIEEVGLLVSDNIKFLRFRNQVRILLKAKEYVEARNISLKEIPIKILVPLLENASLEDNKNLQDKWAKMLANMANSENNLQNQIFPYTLSQISIEEFEALQKLLSEEIEHRKRKAKVIEEQNNYELSAFTKRTLLQKEVDKTEQGGFWLSLEGFELSNIQRLGLIRQLPPRIIIEEFQTGNKYESTEQWHQIDAEYDPEDYGYRITELGERFLCVCDLKDKI